MGKLFLFEKIAHRLRFEKKKKNPSTICYHKRTKIFSHKAKSMRKKNQNMKKQTQSRVQLLSNNSRQKALQRKRIFYNGNRFNTPKRVTARACNSQNITLKYI